MKFCTRSRLMSERLWQIGLASDDVTKLSNAWQRGKLVLNKGSVPYKSMLGEKSLTWRSSLFLRREVRTVLATPSLLSASHFKRYWGSDKCGAVFPPIDDLPPCFCMGRYLCLEPNLPVATPVAGLWRSTCKPYSAGRPLYQYTSEKCSLIILEIGLKSKLLRYVPLSSGTLWKVSFSTISKLRWLPTLH